MRDLGSTNGLILNGQKVEQSQLHHGDLLQLGEGRSGALHRPSRTSRFRRRGAVHRPGPGPGSGRPGRATSPTRRDRGDPGALAFGDRGKVPESQVGPARGTAHPDDPGGLRSDQKKQRRRARSSSAPYWCSWRLGHLCPVPEAPSQRAGSKGPGGLSDHQVLRGSVGQPSAARPRSPARPPWKEQLERIDSPARGRCWPTTMAMFGTGASTASWAPPRSNSSFARHASSARANSPSVAVSFQAVLEEIQGYWLSPAGRSRFEQALERAGQNNYTGAIVDALRSQGVPPEFFYLALQESDFKVNAVGPETRWGRAKGMWQFIPTTAERYGLEPGPLAGPHRPTPRTTGKTSSWPPRRRPDTSGTSTECSPKRPAFW